MCINDKLKFKKITIITIKKCYVKEINYRHFYKKIIRLYFYKSILFSTANLFI